MARPGPRPLLRRSITADAVELYAAGRSCSQVAAELGVAATTVRHALADAGVPRRPRNGRLDVDVDAIVRRYRDGWTMAEVADQLGVSEALARERLAAAGEPSRPQRRRPTAERPQSR